MALDSIEIPTNSGTLVVRASRHVAGLVVLDLGAVIAHLDRDMAAKLGRALVELAGEKTEEHRRTLT